MELKLLLMEVVVMKYLVVRLRLKTIFLNNLINLNLISFYKYFKLFYRNENLIFKIKNILKLIFSKSQRLNNPNRQINTRYNLFRKLFKQIF